MSGEGLQIGNRSKKGQGEEDNRIVERTERRSSKDEDHLKKSRNEEKKKLN